jgi:hypothetical protein
MDTKEVIALIDKRITRAEEEGKEDISTWGGGPGEFIAGLNEAKMIILNASDIGL